MNLPPATANVERGKNVTLHARTVGRKNVPRVCSHTCSYVRPFLSHLSRVFKCGSQLVVRGGGWQIQFSR